MSSAVAVEKLETSESALTPREREGDLVRRAKNGDEDAYGQLVRLYQERVYTTVYSMTGSHDEADDLTQEAFIKGYRSLKSFKENSSFFTWIYRIAVNKTINHLKSARRKRTMSLVPVVICAVTVAILTVIHTLAGTPEILRILLVAVAITTFYSGMQTYGIWKNRN